MRGDLDNAPIARLHALAAALGVPRYRLLRRDQLLAEIAARAETGPFEVAAPTPQSPESEAQPPESEAQPQQPTEPQAREAAEVSSEAEVAGEPVAGILDIVPAGHGYLRLSGLEPGPEDVYVSASQIRRCELRAGDEVSGPARESRRGEHHPALIRVESVNGEAPREERAAGFEAMTPIGPHRRLPLELPADDLLTRAVDLLVPLAYGQRVLVVAEPRSGRTTLLRGLVRAIVAAPDAPAVIVLLIDERPEEVTEWRRQTSGAEIVAAPADLDAGDQVRHAELALALAKRRAERGEDVVVVIDSLTRLGVAYRDPVAVKPAFGAGRELEEPGSGSLTVIATVLRGIEDGEGVLEGVETTENATIVLDASLAAAGVRPAIDVARSGAVGEERLRDPAELDAMRRLRAELRDTEPPLAAEAVANLLRSSASNAELLSSL